MRFLINRSDIIWKYLCVKVIITDVIKHWPAFENWTREKLLQNYGSIVFKTDQGVALTLKNYFQYSGEIISL
jgi:hypothetical protein